LDKEQLYLAGVINENTGGETKVYPTADSELKALTIGREVLVRDVSGGPTNWKRLVVSRFVDKDKVEFTGPKTGRKYVLDTNDCEIDTPGQASGI